MSRFRVVLATLIVAGCASHEEQHAAKPKPQNKPVTVARAVQSAPVPHSVWKTVYRVTALDDLLKKQVRDPSSWGVILPVESTDDVIVYSAKFTAPVTPQNPWAIYVGDQTHNSPTLLSGKGWFSPLSSGRHLAFFPDWPDWVIEVRRPSVPGVTPSQKLVAPVLTSREQDEISSLRRLVRLEQMERYRASTSAIMQENLDRAKRKSRMMNDMALGGGYVAR